MNLKNSYWIKSGVYSLGSRFSTLFFGFGSFYFLIRYLPKPLFGAWSLFLIITTILETSRNGLIQNALIKLMFSHEEKDIHKVVSASWLINFVYTLFVYLMLVLFAGFMGRILDSPDIQPMMMWYGITLLLLVPFSQFNYLQQAKFSFSGIFWSVLARQGLLFASIFTIYLFGWKVSLTNLVNIQSGCVLAGLIVAYFCSRKYLVYKFIIDWPIVKKVFQFGKYVMGTNIFSLVYKSTDQLMAGSVLGPSAAAVYNSAIRLSNLIEYPATSVAEVVYPKSAAKFEEGKEASTKLFFEKSVGLTMALTVPLVLFTFLLADYIIYFIAGPAYAESANILRVTILFGLFTPFSRQFGAAMDSSGRPQINFAVLCASVVINLVCNYIGIHLMGLQGVAYGTLVSYIIIAGINYYLMNRIFDIRMANVFGYMQQYTLDGFGLAKKVLTRKTQ